MSAHGIVSRVKAWLERK